MSELATYTPGRGEVSTFSQINLNSPEESRETFARMIEAYGRGEISENQARALTYMMAQFLPYWKMEREAEIEKRVAEIERVLREKKRHG